MRRCAMEIMESAEQNIITVQPEEMAFFEEFTKKYAISWTREEKLNNILPLSKSYVGYITTPTRIISLNPKYHEIGFEHIIRIYLYVYGYRPTDSTAILDVSESETSADVASMFIKNLKRNIQEGIIRSYQKTDIRSESLQGKVNYTRTYTNVLTGKGKPVMSRVSKLSIKNNINSLILSALEKLKHTDEYFSDAAQLEMYFYGADKNVQNGSALLQEITFNSNTARYRRTLTYAAMIIDQLTYSDKGSSVGTDSFLINFDRLFEDFVVKVLKEIPEKREFTTWSAKKRFADVIGSTGVYSGREYQPDIIYRYKEEDEVFDYMPSAYAVLDVKNKAYGQFKNADIYQIMMYAKLLHSEKALLLYPSFTNRRTEILSLNSEIFNPSLIYACFVNIGDESGDKFLQSIHEFANNVVYTIQDI